MAKKVEGSEEKVRERKSPTVIYDEVADKMVRDGEAIASFAGIPEARQFVKDHKLAGRFSFLTLRDRKEAKLVEQLELV